MSGVCGNIKPQAMCSYTIPNQPQRKVGCRWLGGCLWNEVRVEARVSLEQCQEGTLLLLMALENLTLVILLVVEDAFFPGGFH